MRDSPPDERPDTFQHRACKRNSPRAKRRDRFQHGACKRNSPPDERRDRPANHYHNLSLKLDGRWGTTDDFITSFLHFPLFSTALWDLVNSRPVHSLMLSFHPFLCLPCLLPLFTVPCKTVLARPDDNGRPSRGLRVVGSPVGAWHGLLR